MAIDFNILMLFFLYSLIVGAGIGAVYDVFRIVRIILPKAKTVIFFEDLLFCLTAAVIMSIFIFNAGYGIVRGYALIGSGIGFTVYYMTVGKIVYRLSEIIIAFIKKAIRFITALIAAPFIAAAKGLKKLFLYIRRNIKQKILLGRVINGAADGFGLCHGSG